jgi:DNA/RNA-binding domain of Phe-tRNA-synthetase-like protein
VLLVGGIRPDIDVAPALEAWYRRARERLGDRAESELPEVGAWRRAYAQMGLRPTQYRSAAEALLRRFRREGAVPRVHPLVDLCNALSLAHALPVAVFDLAGVAGDLEVRHARGDEAYLDFSGQAEAPDPGEVIFADSAGHAHARRWTVTAATRDALIVCEGLHATAAADVPALVDSLAGEVDARWGAPRGRAVLTAAAPRFDLRRADGPPA